MNVTEYQDNLFQINEESFNSIALELFRYQAMNNSVYAEYIDLSGVDIQKINRLSEIPFLPIEAYKYRDIKTGQWESECIFESSGTTNDKRSVQHVNSLEWYHTICAYGFNKNFGNMDDFVFLALMPHYLEQKNSSLITMLKYFMKYNPVELSEAFYLNDFIKLSKDIDVAVRSGKKIILFGVSFALLELVQHFQFEAANITVIETGGMKGRRNELSKSELQKNLNKGFPFAKICSEYGMTELTSQAYSCDGKTFTGPFLKFLISDLYDPLKMLKPGERGIINIIDLSNIHTCAFIKTGDVGISLDESSVQILGRADYAELRGCAQLTEDWL